MPSRQPPPDLTEGQKALSAEVVALHRDVEARRQRELEARRQRRQAEETDGGSDR